MPLPPPPTIAPTPSTASGWGAPYPFRPQASVVPTQAPPPPDRRPSAARDDVSGSMLAATTSKASTAVPQKAAVSKAGMTQQAEEPTWNNQSSWQDRNAQGNWGSNDDDGGSRWNDTKGSSSWH